MFNIIVDNLEEKNQELSDKIIEHISGKLIDYNQVEFLSEIDAKSEKGGMCLVLGEHNFTIEQMEKFEMFGEMQTCSFNSENQVYLKTTDFSGAFMNVRTFLV